MPQQVVHTPLSMTVPLLQQARRLLQVYSLCSYKFIASFGGQIWLECLFNLVNWLIQLVYRIGFD